MRGRAGRAHTGKFATEQSNARWCSDALEIACWNGKRMQVGFPLDYWDREALAWVAAPRDLTGRDIRLLMNRAVAGLFPKGRTSTPVKWLSDNGSTYTAPETQIHAEKLGLLPVAAPARSPQANGMREAFVNALKRDYVQSTELWSAAYVIALLPEWIEDYNEHAPHSALGMKSPREYGAKGTLTASL